MDFLPTAGLFVAVAAASTLRLARERKRASTQSPSSVASRAIHYRWATPADRHRIASLVLRNHLDLSLDHPEEWIRQVLDVPADFRHLLRPEIFAQGMYRVAELRPEGDIVGCAGATPSKQNHNHDGDDGGDSGVDASLRRYDLTAVTVARDWRRRGVARRLIESVLVRAIAGGIEVVVLVTLKEASPARWLYQELGFRLVREEVVAEMPRRMTVMTYELTLKHFGGGQR